VSIVKLVVAVGGHHQRRETFEAATEQPQDIERCLVRPMQVLEHQDRRRGTRYLVGEHRQHLMGTGSVLNQIAEPSACKLGHLDERLQRPRSEQRFARTPQGPTSLLAAEPPHERRLPDPRLASHQDEAALPGLPCRRQRIAKHIQMLGALEQRGSRRHVGPRGSHKG
jgi:hypothetical protein